MTAPAPSFLKAFADGYKALGLDTDVYAGAGPDNSPSTYTVIRQTGGLEFNWPTDKVMYVTFKVILFTPARQAYGPIHERATAAHDAMHERRAWLLNGYRADMVRALQPPFDEGVVNGQQVVSFNLFVNARKLRPATPAQE
jgi:hypothetical protein